MTASQPAAREQLFNTQAVHSRGNAPPLSESIDYSSGIALGEPLEATQMQHQTPVQTAPDATQLTAEQASAGFNVVPANTHGDGVFYDSAPQPFSSATHQHAYTQPSHNSVQSDALDNGSAEEKDIEKGEELTFDPFSTTSKFDLELFLREVIREQQQKNNEPRKMGLAFKDLTVTGYGVGAKLNSTVGSLLLSPVEALMNIGSLIHPPVKYILRDITGCVKPGEMLLVLGRPGAGCTTFLKSLCSYRDGFRSIEGTVLYEGLDHKAIDGPLRGDVVYSPEDDIHFPTLTVSETLGFAVATRAPSANHRVG